MQHHSDTQKGFTLIEILLVVAVIVILAGIVIVAVNPGRQLGQANDAQRETEVGDILSAVNQYQIDNGGSLPSAINQGSECPAGGSTDSEIAKTNATSTSGLIDLSDLTDNETYLSSIPADPDATSTNNGTGYHIVKSANDRVTVCAPLTQQGDQIEVTR